MYLCKISSCFVRYVVIFFLVLRGITSVYSWEKEKIGFINHTNKSLKIIAPYKKMECVEPGKEMYGTFFLDPYSPSNHKYYYVTKMNFQNNSLHGHVCWTGLDKYIKWEIYRGSTYLGAATYKAHLSDIASGIFVPSKRIHWKRVYQIEQKSKKFAIKKTDCGIIKAKICFKIEEIH